jgi:hypothetical protein
MNYIAGLVYVLGKIITPVVAVMGTDKEKGKK